MTKQHLGGFFDKPFFKPMTFKKDPVQHENAEEDTPGEQLTKKDSLLEGKSVEDD